MTLSFSTHVKNVPTYFVEKIWTGFNLGLDGYQIAHKEREYWIQLCAMRKELKMRLTGTVKPKIHTIREDKSNRWKEGMKIHFVINNRTRNRFQFAPVLMVKKIQVIEITYEETSLVGKDSVRRIFVDGKQLTYQEINKLAQNDGFLHAEIFFEYFDKPFKGKIIHWTDQTY